MKRIAAAIIASVLLCSAAFAGIEEARQMQKEKKYEEAEAEYRKALPELAGEAAAQVQFQVGSCLQMQKKYEEAIEEYRKVEKIEGASPVIISYAQYRIGVCLQFLKKHEEAIEEYRKVEKIEGAPGYRIGLAVFGIGRCLESQKKYDEAIEEYRRLETIKGAHKNSVEGAKARIDYITKKAGE